MTGRKQEQDQGSDTSAEAHPQSKIAHVVALLEREEGASLDELIQATGWQKHTLRAALTGLRKKGHRVSREKADGTSRYRIGEGQ